MLKLRSWGLVGATTLTVTILAFNGLNAGAAGDCAATNEEELYAALADTTCGNIITLDSSEIQDKGIQLTKDFNGAGATLIVGTSSYGLLIDDIGLDGHIGVPVGTNITIKNVTIKAAATTKALININDVSVILENVTTDRTATDDLTTPNYYAHIDVKDARSLTLANYTATSGIIAIDYSQEVINNLRLTIDAASAASLSGIPAFISAYGNGVLSPGNPETLTFLTNESTVIAKDGIELTAADKQNLIVTTPFVAASSTEDGRSVVVVEEGAADTVVAEIADTNNDFASFLSQIGDDAVFLALDDRGDCDGEGCQVAVTISNLESHTAYYLYHYDNSGNVELIDQFLADADGYVEIDLKKFSGNVLSKAKIELASTGSTNVLTPQTGTAKTQASANASTSISLIAPLGTSAILIFCILKLTYKQARK